MSSSWLSNSISSAQRGHIGRGVERAAAVLYPNYVSEDDLFVGSIIPYLQKDAFVLDAGCGRGAFFRYPWKQQVRLLVGCDVEKAINQNPNTTTGVRASLTYLPFASSSFDLVFSRYVFEHLDTPSLVFKELARVLKPGGKLVVLTPSKYHYVTLISRLLPHRLHEKVAALRGNAAHDAFPTMYLVNSEADLRRYAAEAGLRMKQVVSREVRPNYLLWSLPAFLLGVAYERLVNRFDRLRPFRVSLIAVFER